MIVDYLILSYIVSCFPCGVTPYFCSWVTPYFFSTDDPILFSFGYPILFFRGEPPGDRAWAFPNFKFGGNVIPYLGGGIQQ